MERPLTKSGIEVKSDPGNDRIVFEAATQNGAVQLRIVDLKVASTVLKLFQSLLAFEGAGGGIREIREIQLMLDRRVQEELDKKHESKPR